MSRFLKQNEKHDPVSAPDKGTRRLVVGNWKCHKNYDEARLWFDQFAENYSAIPDVDIVIAPSLICLESISKYVQALGLAQVYLAAQDVSPFPRGGYTGAVAADMLKGIADYVIVGHSERRRYFHETAMDVTNKVTESIDAGLQAIVCVDQPYAMSQLTGLADLDSKNIIVAYCPVDALSVRIPETPEAVAAFAESVQGYFPGREIIYGGSLTRENVNDYLQLSGLSGVFVGSSSLDAESFLAICRKAGGEVSAA